MIKNNLIGISGKMGSGKDTVGKILQYLSCSPPSVDEINHMMKFITNDKYKSNLDIASNYQIKKYADKLKDIVCLLLNCTREDLEDREFKEKELGEEWWYYTDTLFKGNLYGYNEYHDKLKDDLNYYIIKLTPRKLLQLLGTECGRQIIHPNIWVNALMSEYKQIDNYQIRNYKLMNNQEIDDSDIIKTYPNWLITDTRFPNEAKAIKDRGGIVIRINRTYYTEDKKYIMGHDPFETHPSETALDDYEFDRVIDNNGSIEELVEKVKKLNLV